MGWKIIEIDKQCSLRVFMDNLIIIRETRITIPISDIDVILITDNRISMSINLLNTLSENGVAIIFCNQKFIPKSILIGINVKKQSYKIFEAQLLWNQEFKIKNWSIISFIKITNQLKLLKMHQLKINEWENVIRDDINYLELNYESQVANLFFHEMYGVDFNRKELIQINYLLNFGYIILTSMVTRSIIKKGLHHQVSLFHGSRYSQFPLAYDLVEPFRIIVDYFVKELFDKGIITNKDEAITKEQKQCCLEFIANFKIKIDNQFIFLNNAIDTFIDWLINDEIRDHSFQILFEEEF